MATERQIAANRRNAQKSTGPTTTEGKQHSRWNALKHGLASQHTVLPHEDPNDYHQIRADLIDTWKPANAQELMLVDQVANGYWRMERSRRFENAMFDNQVRTMKSRHDLDESPHHLDDEAIAISFFDEENEKGYRNYMRYDARAQSTYFRALDHLRRVVNDRLRREARQFPSKKTLSASAELASFGTDAPPAALAETAPDLPAPTQQSSFLYPVVSTRSTIGNRLYGSRNARGRQALVCDGRLAPETLDPGPADKRSLNCLLR